MADEEVKKTGQPGEAFLSCVVDHHALVNKEEAYPDVFLHVDEKAILTAHYYVLKSTPALLMPLRRIPNALLLPFPSLRRSLGYLPLLLPPFFCDEIFIYLSIYNDCSGRRGLRCSPGERAVMVVCFVLNPRLVSL